MQTVSSKLDMMDQDVILIVDDNPGNLQVLSTLLTGAGYRVRVATDGEQAVKSVQAEQPDLVLLDIQMPHLDGYEACRQINRLDEFLPVLFVSGVADEFNSVRGFEAGGVDYIAKPFVVEVVLARVKTHLELYKSRRALKEKNIALLKEYEATFEQAAVGIAHFSARHRKITKANTKLCELLGYTPRDIYELTLKELVHPDYLAAESEKMASVISGQAGHYTNEVPVKRRNGDYIWIRITVHSVRKDSGETDYLAGIIEDISERKAAETALNTKSERFDLATRAAKVGVWDWYITSGYLVWEDGMFDLYGVERSKYTGAYSDWSSRVHPEDLTAAEAAVQTALNGDSELDTEFRIRRDDGKEVRVKAIATVVRDDHGKPLRMIGANWALK